MRSKVVVGEFEVEHAPGPKRRRAGRLRVIAARQGEMRVDDVDGIDDARLETAWRAADEISPVPQPASSTRPLARTGSRRNSSLLLRPDRDRLGREVADHRLVGHLLELGIEVVGHGAGAADRGLRLWA